MPEVRDGGCSDADADLINRRPVELLPLQVIEINSM